MTVLKVLITGCCGFVGSRLLTTWARSSATGSTTIELYGMDNLSRPGGELNRQSIASLCTQFRHGDLRVASDLEPFPRVDWVIDASANPSVLAGADGQTSSRQLIEHNLLSTVNLLEFCKRHQAGFILLSTSRVYSIPALQRLPLQESGNAFTLAADAGAPAGVGPAGITEEFSTTPPLSLYGSTKLASELLALEYGQTFQFPVWINRCGVLAGAGQFGHAEQGIVSYWIHSWFEQQPLRYIGFQGRGFQVRDCLHPEDLADLVLRQMTTQPRTSAQLFNVAGGDSHRFSLAELSAWCSRRFGPREIATDVTPRKFDVPWLILDSSRAREAWNWSPQRSRDMLFDEIAAHAEAHPNWTSRSK